MLIVGFDAANWVSMEPMIEKGKLPNIQSLIEAGSAGSLQTFIPTASPAIWTTIATGQSPDKHGIAFRVLQLDEGQRVEEMLAALSSDERRVPALWNMLSDKDLRSAFIGWWSTWPAEEIAGYMITDKLHEQTLKRTMYPPDLRSELRETGIFDAALPAEQEKFLREVRARFRAWRSAVEEGAVVWNGRAPDVKLYFKDLEEKIQAYKRIMTLDYRTELIAHYLMDKDPTIDVIAPYFWYSDICQHIFWKYWRPEGFNLDAKELEIFSPLVPEYYRFMDGVVGRLCEHVGKKTQIVVVSDHGMESYHTDKYVNDLFDVELLLEDLDWLVRHKGKKPDFSKSKAYVKASSRQVRLINLSLDGREPGGRIAPNQLASTASVLVEELRSLLASPSNQPLFSEVRTLESEEKSYKLGEFVFYVFEQADIALTLNAHLPVSDSLEIADKLYPLGRWNKWRPSISGQHHIAPCGIVILSGPSFRRGYHIHEARVHDITPTLLAALRLPIAGDMDGRVLEEAFRDSYFEDQPLQTIPTYGERPRVTLAKAPVPGTDEELVRQLKAIGYLR